MKEYHKSALAETGLILIFTILPTIFLLGKFYFNPEGIEFNSIYKSGEFFLYAVSFLGSSFLVYNHYKVKKSDTYSLLSFLSLIFIVLFSLAYTALSNTTLPNLIKIQNLSILALIISIPLFYYSQVVNNKFASIDVGEKRRDEQETIEDALI
jgi:hypothetical protein